MEPSKIKSFWEKPEGNTGLFVLAALILAGGTGLYLALPIIITLLANTLTAIALGTVLFAIICVVMNDGFRAMVESGFQSTMRAMTGVFIAVDPIGILKNYLVQMKERLAKVEKHIVELNQQITRAKTKIKEKAEHIDQFLRLAKAYKKEGKEGNAALEASKAQREKDFVDTLSVNIDKMEGYYKNLNKIKENLNLLYEDTEHKVETKTEEYEFIKSSYKAIKGAEELVKGDSQKALFEQDMEYITNDIANKIGEMDRFMETSQDFMNTMDINKAVFNEKGLELLAQWEQNGSSILNYDKNRNSKIRVDTASNSVSMASEDNEQETNSSFSSIFNKR